MVRHGAIAAATVVICDQLSKHAILHLFAGRAPDDHVVVAPFFNLLLTRNSGISFGMFNGVPGANALVFSLAAAAVIAILFYWLTRVDNRFLAIAIGLIIGGAAGNVIDRLLGGSVIDFLDFHLGAWHWPAFNIADSAICLGVVAMLLEGLVLRRTSSEVKG
jgi:signal peptidase II